VTQLFKIKQNLNVFVRLVSGTQIPAECIYEVSFPGMQSHQTLHEMRRLLRCGVVLIPLPRSNKPSREEWNAAVKAGKDAAARKAQATAPKKDVYDGQIQDNERNGPGKMNYANGDVYTGLWLDDQRNGQGNITYANGNTYQGNWKADKMKGIGKFIHKSPEQEQFDWKFCGEFENDFPVCGTLTYKQNETCNQTYATEWSQLDIQAQMPSTNSTQKQEKNGVDPKSDSLSDDNPKKTDLRNEETWNREANRNDADEEKRSIRQYTLGKRSA
jgi:hypothetical protein